VKAEIIKEALIIAPSLMPGRVVLLPRQPVTGGAELDPYRLVTPE
jgi:hypothetical protein